MKVTSNRVRLSVLFKAIGLDEIVLSEATVKRIWPKIGAKKTLEFIDCKEKDSKVI